MKTKPQKKPVPKPITAQPVGIAFVAARRPGKYDYGGLQYGEGCVMRTPTCKD